MALNFKIIRHQNSENLHLKLIGDFDGTSADELINALRSSRGIHGKIFIHTSSLKSVHPFGADLFKRKCRCIVRQHVILTGEYAYEMAFPEAGLI